MGMVGIDQSKGGGIFLTSERNGQWQKLISLSEHCSTFLFVNPQVPSSGNNTLELLSTSTPCPPIWLLSPLTKVGQRASRLSPPARKTTKEDDSTALSHTTNKSSALSSNPNLACYYCSSVDDLCGSERFAEYKGYRHSIPCQRETAVRDRRLSN